MDKKKLGGKVYTIGDKHFTSLDAASCGLNKDLVVVNGGIWESGKQVGMVRDLRLTDEERMGRTDL